MLNACSHLSRSDLDVEIVPLVRYLQDLWPRESVDPQSVSVDEKATTAHAQHDSHALRVLHTHIRTFVSEEVLSKRHVQHFLVFWVFSILGILPTLRPDPHTHTHTQVQTLLRVHYSGVRSVQVKPEQGNH